MAAVADATVGSVGALWRYPVKSMLGEELNATTIGQRGLLGDRLYAIVDPSSGKVASAKNPRKWPHLFACRSAFVEPPQLDVEPPAVELTLPDGLVTRSDDPDCEQTLATMLGRPGRLQRVIPKKPVLEEYWPDIEGLDLRDTVTDEGMPEGTFFDLATVHLLTTATLDRLRALYPAGRFEVRRFRPNIVIATPPQEAAFVEGAWVERTLAIGEEVKLKVTRACPRCVMTTLPQADLPADPGILRTAVAHNDAHVGVYAEVIQGGHVRRTDLVRVE